MNGAAPRRRVAHLRLDAGELRICPSPSACSSSSSSRRRHLPCGVRTCPARPQPQGPSSTPTLHTFVGHRSMAVTWLKVQADNLAHGENGQESR